MCLYPLLLNSMFEMLISMLFIKVEETLVTDSLICTLLVKGVHAYLWEMTSSRPIRLFGQLWIPPGAHKIIHKGTIPSRWFIYRFNSNGISALSAATVTNTVCLFFKSKIGYDRRHRTAFELSHAIYRSKASYLWLGHGRKSGVKLARW